jgi:hypothetical protein
MFQKYKLIFLLTMMLTISSIAILFAQSRQKAIQLKISRLNFSSYERVKNHVEFEMALSFPVANRLTFRPEIGYYQSKHYWNYRSLEYRGTTYTSRNGQLWRNNSLIPTLLFQPYQHFYLGTGMGIDIIYVKGILYTDWRSFWIDQNDNVIEVGKETYHKTKICFAGSINVGWEQPVWRNISIFIEGKYKIIFAGNDLTGTSDSKVMTFSVFMGSSFRF